MTIFIGIIIGIIMFVVIFIIELKAETKKNKSIWAKPTSLITEARIAQTGSYIRDLI